MTKRDGKLIAATVTVMGIIFTIFGEIFGPEIVIWHKAPWYGNVAGKLGWILVLIAPLIYVFLDWENIFPKRKTEITGERIVPENIEKGEKSTQM